MMVANKRVQAKAEKLSSMQFKLSKGLYAIDAIESAATEFNKVSQIAIESKESSYIITISPKNRANARLIGYEFCNYVLGLMKEKSPFE
jgi:hypothetical protein